jgi:prepilin-type N-terminal cleavage/methylation domain-containing protein
MRRGLTLIELIFTMVIVAVVFTVIPKLIQSFAQSGAVSIKEDALYNAVALAGLMSALPWDEENVDSDAILFTDNVTNYACSQTTGYRTGGFVGGRNCIQDPANATTPVALGREDGFYNDFDDYHNEDRNSSVVCGGVSQTVFVFDVNVSYVNETNYAPQPNSTHAKMAQINVNKHGTNECVTSLFYTAYNIGQIQINKRPWR